MKLVTRCPECNTAFRVYEEQLEARGGQVRCGACKQVFDAYASLEERPLDMEGPPTLMPREPARKPPAPVPAPVPAPMPVKPRVVEIAGAPTTVPGPPSAPSQAPEPAPRNLIETAPEESEFDAEAAPEDGARAGWIAAAAVLGVLALLQLAFVFRGDLVARYPGTRAVVGPVCAMLGCSIALPRVAENIQIESSDLQSDGAALLTLTTVLRNKAPFSQAMPSIELTLTDARDQPVARRVLRPLDYLDTPSSEASGIPAGGDLVAKVYIDASQLAAQSYKLLVFYP